MQNMTQQSSTFFEQPILNSPVLSLAEQWINTRRTQRERRLDRLGAHLASLAKEERSDAE